MTSVLPLHMIVRYYLSEEKQMFFTINLAQDSSKQNQYLSTTLLDMIHENLKEDKKIILYLNKRGSFSSVVCQDCGYLFECPNCDTSLSVHHTPDRLLCHLCGKTDNIPLRCSKCWGNHLKNVWVGTQQIEKSLRDIFSKANIYRFDTDALKTKWTKTQALESLTQADIIIGTKMITTGFDFENVGLIGILLLEQELSYPQYDIEEKVYTNLRQLIGRWERKWESTDVILQTFIPQNDFVQLVTDGNYRDFFRHTLEERQMFWYPPFTQMTTLEYRHTQKQKAESFMQMLYNKLQILNKQTSYNIQFVSLPFKKNNQYHYKIIIKGNDIRTFLQEIEAEVMRNWKLSVLFS